MTTVFRLKGPPGGPAAVSICLVTPGGGRRRSTAVLSAREHALLDRRVTAAAKTDFTAGRQAAHTLLGDGVEVLRARDGRPNAMRNSRRMRGVSLSIGHTRGRGVAAVVDDAAWVVGVDIETRRSLSPRLTSRVLTLREKRRVSRQPAKQRGLATIEHWVLKEAGLKTVGAGVARLISSPDAAEVISLNRRGWGRLSLAGERRARGRLIQRGELTMAVVLLRR